MHTIDYDGPAMATEDCVKMKPVCTTRPPPVPSTTKYRVSRNLDVDRVTCVRKMSPVMTMTHPMYSKVNVGITFLILDAALRSGE